MNVELYVEVPDLKCAVQLHEIYSNQNKIFFIVVPSNHGESLLHQKQDSIFSVVSAVVPDDVKNKEIQVLLLIDNMADTDPDYLKISNAIFAAQDSEETEIYAGIAERIYYALIKKHCTLLPQEQITQTLQPTHEFFSKPVYRNRELKFTESATRDVQCFLKEHEPIIRFNENRIDGTNHVTIRVSDDNFNAFAYILLRRYALNVHYKNTQTNQWDNYLACEVSIDRNYISYQNIDSDIIYKVDYHESVAHFLIKTHWLTGKKTYQPIGRDSVYLPASKARELIKELLAQPGVVVIEVFEKACERATTYRPVSFAIDNTHPFV